MESGPSGGPPPRPALTLAQLESLIAVVDSGGFTKAAGRAGAARVHHQVRRLEEAIGVSLFDATRRREVSARLTPAGEAVVRAARQALAGVAELRTVAAAADRPGTERWVTAAAYPSQVRIFAARAARLVAGQARVRFHGLSDGLRTVGGDALFQLLDDQRVDVAVCPAEGGVDVGRFEARRLYAWRMVAVPPRGETLADAIKVADLVQQPVLCSPPGHRSRLLLERAATRVGRRLDPWAESDSIEALAALAREHGGWLVAPDDSLPVRYRVKVMVVLGPSGRPIGGSYAVVSRRNDRRPEVAAFTAACEQLTHGLRMGASSRAQPLAGAPPVGGRVRVRTWQPGGAGRT